MSSYSCVVPVDWHMVDSVILPAWTALFHGTLTRDGFIADFLSNISQASFTHWTEPWTSLPPAYLADIGWNDHRHHLDANRLRRSPLHAQLGSISGQASAMMITALKYRASAPLPLPAATDDQYYGRLHDHPTISVAGFKNTFTPLDRLYHATYEPGSHWNSYAYRRRDDAPPVVCALLERLMLACRSFPGMVVLNDGQRWPGCNGELLQGYLMPLEVAMLARHLERIVPEAYSERWPSAHSALFADRVARAAEFGYGLVTLHDAL